MDRGPIQLTPKSELDLRLSRIQKEMKNDGLDAQLILQQADKFYFSGTVQDGIIFIPQEGQIVFMVRKSLARAQAESELDFIVPFRRYREISDILKVHDIEFPQTIGMELDVMPVGIFRKLQGVFPNVKILDASSTVKKIRMEKSQYELEIMKIAGDILARAMMAVPDLLTEGMTEIELAAETEIILRKSGHQGVIRMRKWNQECFYGLILSGESGAISNYMDAPLGGVGPCPAAPRGASMKKIRRNEPIIIDMVSAVNGYVVDCTRTFWMGKLNEQLSRALEVAIEIQGEVVGRYRSGVNLKEIYDMAHSMAQKEGLGDYFMGYGDSKVKFLGHGVGLELDEMPVIAEGFNFILGKNMTLAIEPKFLFPKIGAVGVENTWASKEGDPVKISDLDDVLV
jgi:Xaa-Pro dipeptidase